VFVCFFQLFPPKLVLLSLVTIFIMQVLWLSDNGIPDLGGIHEEDTCFADEVSLYLICLMFF
jgi:hypothetical protein